MRKTWILAALFAVAGLVGSASAASFISDSNANAGTITIDSTGGISVTTFAGNYDGVEDVVYNVVNNWNQTVTGFTVHGGGIAGFDGDGIDNYAHADGSTPTGAELRTAGGTYNSYGDLGTSGLIDASAQGYAGYTDSMANSYGVVTTSGGIDFVPITFGNGGIAANDSAFISFEEPADIKTFGVGGVPLPPAVWSGLALILGIGVYTKFAKAKIA